MKIAYYANHQGSGHIQHARALARTVDCDLLVLSTLDYDTSDSPRVRSVALSDDTVADYHHTAGTAFHYTPTGKNIRKRYMLMAAALDDFQPDVVIVDVSIEVATFIKLLGYTVIYRLLHGNRTDRGHQQAFHLVDGLIAYYPEQSAPGGMQKWLRKKTAFIGMLAPDITTGTIIPDTVCVMNSTGGHGALADDVAFAARQTPTTRWIIIGTLSGDTASLPDNCTYHGMVDDPDTYLSSAEIIISASGHNAVARSVAHGRPLILSPEQRPFDEQLLFARSLAALSDAMVVTSWQDQDWPALLRQAKTQNPQKLSDQLLVSPAQYGNNLMAALNKHLSRL